MPPLPFYNKTIFRNSDKDLYNKGTNGIESIMSSVNSLNYCPNCGTKILPQARFCIECGYEVEKLRKLMDETQKPEMDIENVNNPGDVLEDETRINEKSDNRHEHIVYQAVNDEANTEQEEITKINVPENDIRTDIELVRPDYNESGRIIQNNTEDDKIEEDTIQIEVSDDDYNDFDIIRPDTQKNDKKQSKDFSILNQKKIE